MESSKSTMCRHTTANRLCNPACSLAERLPQRHNAGGAVPAAKHLRLAQRTPNGMLKLPMKLRQLLPHPGTPRRLNQGLYALIVCGCKFFNNLPRVAILIHRNSAKYYSLLFPLSAARSNSFNEEIR
jgi:hypothetical protein